MLIVGSLFCFVFYFTLKLSLTGSHTEGESPSFFASGQVLKVGVGAGVGVVEPLPSTSYVDVLGASYFQKTLTK